MDKPTIEMFWTGGFDSTFAMILYSQMQIVVQPVYHDCGRASREYELGAMKTITQLLIEHPHTVAEIRPLKIIQYSDIPKNSAITDASNRLRKQFQVGTQYEYLARWAKHHPGIGVAAVKPDGEFSGISSCIGTVDTDRLLFQNGAWHLNKNLASQDAWLLFGSFSLPTIGYTETEMKARLKQMGGILR